MSRTTSEAAMPVSADTYERVALEDPEGFWELWDGCLRQKPEDLMTTEHNQVLYRLARALMLALDPDGYEVRTNSGRTRRRSRSYYIPDVFVVPRELVERAKAEGHGKLLESYVDALPLVVEIWSPSTGRYDVDAKLPEYQRRGDQEIWRVHPYERTVTVYRRHPDGGYTETVYRGGRVPVAALPGVVIDLDALFG